MGEFYCSPVLLSHQHPAFSKVGDLMIKLSKSGPSFVIDIRIRDKLNLEIHFFHSDAQLNIFCEAVKMKSACPFKNFSADTHVEAAWLKVVWFPSTNSSSC